MITRSNRLHYHWSNKHLEYMRKTRYCAYNIAEGSVRSGKTTDNVFCFAQDIKRSTDRIYLASASTGPTAKLIIGDCDGYGLEHIFRGQCRWGKYKGNEALLIKGPDTGHKQKIVLFCGGAKADSYKKFRGMTIGAWIATEIDLHHKNTIDEALRRQINADAHKLYWDLNPGSPHAAIYREYIDLWQEQDQSGSLIGGFNYESFNLFDNVNLSQHNIDITLARYQPGTVQYRRDIEGKRCAAEGLIYGIYANDPKRFAIDKLPEKFDHLFVGLDWGDSRSDHALVLCGIAKGSLYALEDLRFSAKGLDPMQVLERCKLWIDAMQDKYKRIEYVFCDAANQTMQSGLRKRIGIPVADSKKGSIKERIDATVMLMAAGRFYIANCPALSESFCEAVYDPKAEGDVRLDNGTFCVDILDAFEYAWSRYTKALTAR